MRNYELMLILRANLDKKVADEAIDKIVGLITGKDGQATRVKGWGRRKLAYEIDKQSEGIYALFKVTLAPNALEDIKFNLKLDENIIRYTFVKDTVVKPHEASSDEAEKPVVSEKVLADDDSEKDSVSEDADSTESSSDASTLDDTPSTETSSSADESISSTDEATSSTDESTSSTDEAEENTSEAPVDESSEVKTVDE